MGIITVSSSFMGCSCVRAVKFPAGTSLPSSFSLPRVRRSELPEAWDIDSHARERVHDVDHY